MEGENIHDSDSNDSDIFVVKQIKPVNTPQLIQLTLQETYAIKGAKNFLNEIKSRKSKKRNKGRNHSSDSNKTEFKKRKLERHRVSRGDQLSQYTGTVKNKSDVHTINVNKNAIKKVGTNNVKNAPKCIHSLFLEKVNSDSKESQLNQIIPGDQLKSCKKCNKHKSSSLKSHALSTLKNFNDVNESFSINVSEESVEEPLILIDQKDHTSKIKCLSEKTEGTINIEGFKNNCNFEGYTKYSENLTVELESNSNSKDYFLFDNFGNEIFNDSQNCSTKEKFNDNSDLLCFLLKKMISEEMKKQIALENHFLENEKKVEKLLLEYECEIMEKFFNLNENACKIFVRMLCRKKGWHRISTIHYPSISNNINLEFEILYKEGFIDINIEDEDLQTQLNLLSKIEVLELCKALNIPIKSGNNPYKKETLISYLVNDNKKQKSVIDMFRGEGSTVRLNLLKSKLKIYLGSCVRLKENILQIFYKILLLFSFAHYHDDEDKRLSNELFMCLKLHKNIMKFPNYKLSPTVVFETLEDFEQYKNSLLLKNDFKIAISNKNYDGFICTSNKAKIEFNKLLENNEYHKRFLNLKPFLRKFSAGAVYAKILTKYCKTFKKQTSSSDRTSTVQLLLSQNLFLTSKKGEWYELLLKDFENQKQSNAAAELLIKSLSDSEVDEVQKLSLQLRGQSLLKKKSCKINSIELRDMLSNLCTLSVQEPHSVEIKGKALDGNESGFKSVYVEQFEDGKVYTTVEERAVSYYKSNGFPKGHHSEGFIIQSIYFLLFFDIVYGSSPEGVFQSPYQTAPLDLNSRFFFHNRKEEIELLMDDMLTWDDRQIEAKISDSYYKNYNNVCVVTWNDKFTPELFCEVIKCIKMPALVSIFHRLVKNFRISRSGFPDLTLWNPDTEKCKFVEVKSPNDKLSPGQRLWLDYLRNIGMDCEVCNVKNVCSKSFK